MLIIKNLLIFEQLDIPNDNKNVTGIKLMVE